MKVLLGGGTGFIGKNLKNLLTRKGHKVTVISRTTGEDRLTWDQLKFDGLTQKYDAILNLAGENILNPFYRWNDTFKSKIETSRIDSTKLLADLIKSSPHKPQVWVSSSAVGFYPPDPSKEYTEESEGGRGDYLADLCRRWEAASMITLANGGTAIGGSAPVVGGSGSAVGSGGAPVVGGSGAPVVGSSGAVVGGSGSVVGGSGAVVGGSGGAVVGGSGSVVGGGGDETTESVRHVIVRIGVVLGRDGGTIAKAYWPFLFGLGGQLASGKQWFPWIHVNDLCGIMLFAMLNKDVKGVLNGTAPNPVTNAQFTKSLANSLNRPAFAWVPEGYLNLVFGAERAAIMTKGQRVLPQRTLKYGYEFEYSDITSACQQIANSKSACDIGKN